MDEKEITSNEEEKQQVLHSISDFHGHLGPYVVIGYRMGEIANDELGLDPFEKKAVVKTGRKPPISCIVDGIQLSSGCTLGKGNINVEREGEPIAIFSSDDKKLQIVLKEKIQNKIDGTSEDDMRSLSKDLFSKPVDELFEIDLQV